MVFDHRRTVWLALGDAAAILLLSIIGYLTHYAGKEPFSLRWLSTFLPFCLGWAMAAVPMGLYNPRIAQNWLDSFWRAALGAALAAAFATMLRGFWLNAPVQPIFMGVLASMGALAMALWRFAWGWFSPKIKTA
jgi:hypothetical protein